MYLPETAPYLDPQSKRRILFEMYSNAFRTIQNVYVFRHLDAYIQQVDSNANAAKGEVYWNATYSEKLMGYVKMSIAFETYNKAVLLEKGVLIHKLGYAKEIKQLRKEQNNGRPVMAAKALEMLGTAEDENDRLYLNGLLLHFQTISYSDTLKQNYQDIIGLPSELLPQLININRKRNQLHYFIDFRGAYNVEKHILGLQFLKNTCTKILERAAARVANTDGYEMSL